MVCRLHPLNLLPNSHRNKNASAINEKRLQQEPFFVADDYSQYTHINRKIHTTSTKCQYQAAASKAK